MSGGFGRVSLPWRRSAWAAWVMPLLALSAPQTMAGTMDRALPPAPFVDRFVDGRDGAAPAMVRLPGGRTAIGAPDHRVDIMVSPFAIGQFAVSNAEFAAFLQAAGDRDNDGIPYLTPPSDPSQTLVRIEGGRVWIQERAERLPVTGVSWQGALAFVGWLSARTGHVYALPSEAQWEYAARAGGNAVTSRTNCDHGARSAALAAVDNAPPDRFGLYHMIGNAWQWMADCFAPALPPAGAVDPVFFRPHCVTPSMRGGSFASPAAFCQPDFRTNTWWRGLPGYLGFRVVRLDLQE